MPRALRLCFPVAVLVAITAVMQAQPSEDDAEQKAFQEMADAERAFAATAKVKGVRDAFIEWFADDAVGFQPTRGRAQEQLRAQPRPENPLAATLEWEPRAGDISRSGRFGWLTGPYTFTSPKGEKRHGCYFSVWEKTSAGWRVYMDVGAGTPSPVAFAPGLVRMPATAGRYAAKAPPGDPAGRQESLDAGAALLAADTAANGSGAGALTANRGVRLAEAMDANARLHRPGQAPIVGRDAIRAHFDRHPWTGVVLSGHAGTRLAPALDMGVTDGTYGPAPGATVSAGPIEDTAAAAARKPLIESGHYIRVWRRAADGRWRIVADLTQPSLQP